MLRTQQLREIFLKHSSDYIQECENFIQAINRSPYEDQTSSKVQGMPDAEEEL